MSAELKTPSKVEWDSYRSEIEDMYLNENPGLRKSYSEICDILSQKHGKFITTKSLDYRLRGWGLRKTMSASKYQLAFTELSKRKALGMEAEDTTVLHNGVIQQVKRLNREFARHRVDFHHLKLLEPGRFYIDLDLDPAVGQDTMLTRILGRQSSLKLHTLKFTPHFVQEIITSLPSFEISEAIINMLGGYTAPPSYGTFTGFQDASWIEDFIQDTHETDHGSQSVVAKMLSDAVARGSDIPSGECISDILTHPNIPWTIRTGQSSILVPTSNQSILNLSIPPSTIMATSTVNSGDIRTIIRNTVFLLNNNLLNQWTLLNQWIWQALRSSLDDKSFLVVLKAIFDLDTVTSRVFSEAVIRVAISVDDYEVVQFIISSKMFSNLKVVDEILRYGDGYCLSLAIQANIVEDYETALDLLVVLLDYNLRQHDESHRYVAKVRKLVSEMEGLLSLGRYRHILHHNMQYLMRLAILAAEADDNEMAFYLLENYIYNHNRANIQGAVEMKSRALFPVLIQKGARVDGQLLRHILEFESHQVNHYYQPNIFRYALEAIEPQELTFPLNDYHNKNFLNGEVSGIPHPFDKTLGSILCYSAIHKSRKDALDTLVKKGITVKISTEEFEGLTDYLSDAERRDFAFGISKRRDVSLGMLKVSGLSFEDIAQSKSLVDNLLTKRPPSELGKAIAKFYGERITGQHIYLNLKQWEKCHENHDTSMIEMMLVSLKSLPREHQRRVLEDSLEILVMDADGITFEEWRTSRYSVFKEVQCSLHEDKKRELQALSSNRLEISDEPRVRPEIFLDRLKRTIKSRSLLGLHLDTDIRNHTELLPDHIIHVLFSAIATGIKLTDYLTKFVIGPIVEGYVFGPQRLKEMCHRLLAHIMDILGISFNPRCQSDNNTAVMICIEFLGDDLISLLQRRYFYSQSEVNHCLRCKKMDKLDEEDTLFSTPVESLQHDSYPQGIDFLLNVGMNPKIGYYGNRLIHLRFLPHYNLSQAVIKRIVESGVDLNECTMYQRPPLLRAVQRQTVWLVRLLLDHKAQPDQYYHFHEYQKYPAQNLGTQMLATMSPLEAAIEKANVPILLMLLEAGADVNLRCCRRLTPLAQAAYRGRSDIVACLLKMNVDAASIEEAIGYATKQGYHAIVEQIKSTRSTIVL